MYPKIQTFMSLLNFVPLECISFSLYHWVLPLVDVPTYPVRKKDRHILAGDEIFQGHRTPRPICCKVFLYITPIGGTVVEFLLLKYTTLPMKFHSAKLVFD